MLKSRFAAVLVAAPLALSPATAHADPILEGCYGAGANVYCDPSVRVSLVQGGSEPTPVCAGTCVWLPVPTASLGDSYEVCIDYTTVDGYPASRCYVSLDSEDISRLYEAIRCRLFPNEC